MACLLLAGLGLRLSDAGRSGWYWDEGYQTENAASLAQGQAPRAGAMLSDGVLPVPCSIVVPLSAVPFHWLPGVDALLAARLWAVALATLGALLLAGIATRCFGRAEALWAVGFWAFWPLAVHYQALALYHPFGATALLAAAWAAVSDRPRTAAALAGLAAIGCYWLWWCPVAIVAWLGWRRAAPWLQLLGLAALAPLLHLGTLLAGDFGTVQMELQRLGEYTAVAKPAFPLPALKLLLLNMAAFPAICLGLLGLGLAWRRGSAPALLLLLLAAGLFLEPWHQRGDLRAMHYILAPALPWACLGCAWLAARLAERPRWGWAPLALLVAALALPTPEELHRAFSADPARSRELSRWLKQALPPGAQVMGMPHLNWALRPELLAFEPADAASAQGLPGGFFPGLPASRFGFQPSVAEAQALVVSRSHVLGFFRQTWVALLFLRAEMEGWPLAFDNKSYRVYLNPRYGARKDPQVRILQGAEFYRLAAEQAGRLGDAPAKAFALRREREAGR